MTDQETAAPAAPAALPEFIFLLDDWGSRLAGSVLRGDHDLVAALDVEGVKYRAATETERGLAAIV